MKRCNACDEEFEDKFSFCPVDATPLNSLAAEIIGQAVSGDSCLMNSPEMPAVSVRASRAEFHLTMIDNAGLAERLAQEFRYLGYQIRLAWPVLKRDPISFSKGMLVKSGRSLQCALTAPNWLAALATAIVLLLAVGLTVVLVSNRSDHSAGLASPEREVAQMFEFPPNPDVPPEDHGIGAGAKEGRVGFAAGRGEGSGAAPKKASGGGSGGQRDSLPAQVGKPPRPSEIQASIPKFPPAQKPTLPVAGIDIDPALWKNLPLAVYGDPRSKSSAPSNGPGVGGGMGTNNGTGIGEGNGPGFGPGKDGNMGGEQKGLGCCGPGGSQGNKVDDPDRIYPAPQVSERARVLAKPEPQYTEEARRNAVTGSVILRVVFSRTGEVTNIRALQSLPFGLTERAIAAARMIRFRPATKDGRAVNVYMQLEYNFNLY
ncbi:MAG TPA: energy transducer TonB [Pyrinomonadaceae bacterium]|nr:energy transducer TonB [Pyrinomonadaceae bacterium]